MTRKLNNWLDAFLEYASVTEAPPRMHFWAGVSAIAGALRRKVWIDMRRYKWYPSFYIIFVAPPGVVSKSTTADISMELLREVPGINFGPDVVTWPALIQSFASHSESFEIAGTWYPMSAMTLVASELGNLINPQDPEVMNVYIDLWDGRKSLTKLTKGAGNDIVEAPWINILGCTTPNWIAGNIPLSAVGGGFTSRCIFVYADKKNRYIPYVDESVEDGDDDLKSLLIRDLEAIATGVAGPFKISEPAREWGRAWYHNFWEVEVKQIEGVIMEGYAARKQTHLHKLAMILSVARNDSLIITLEDMQNADTWLRNLEVDLPKIFAKIGRSEQSLNTEKFIEYVHKHRKVAPTQAYGYVHKEFPSNRDFNDILQGAIAAGLVQYETVNGVTWLVAKGSLGDVRKTLDDIL